MGNDMRCDTICDIPSRRLGIGLIALLCLAVQLPAAHGATEFKKQVAEAAKGIADFLKQKGEEKIAVGQFTGPSKMPSSSGPAIVKGLTDELTTLGITVSRRAKLEVKGDYLAVVDETKRGPAALLHGRILDPAGKVLFEFEKGFSNEATVTEMFGLTVTLPPDEAPRERKKRLRESIDEPQTNFAETRILTGPESPYEMEVLISTPTGYVPRAPTNDDGLAFVDIKKEESYAVRIYNKSPYDAAVSVSIDGLNMFAFTDVPQYRDMGIVIVPAGSSGTVRGWHRNNQVSDAFLVTDYAKSAAAELKQTSDIGMITCTFAAAWPQGTEAPPDESVKRNELATARGAQLEAKYQEVARHIGKTRGAVSVRYIKPVAP